MSSEELEAIRRSVERQEKAGNLTASVRHQRALLAEVDRLRELVGRFQWSGVSIWGDRICPECEAKPSEGHGHSENPHSPRSCQIGATLGEES